MMEISFSYVVFNIIFMLMLIYYCYQLNQDKKILQKQLEGDINALSNNAFNSSKHVTDNTDNTNNTDKNLLDDVETTSFTAL